MAEKTQKKVTKACNNCRLKKKKCDGLHPCSLCSENSAECLYSSEPKRRGPPSGYLRHTETRLILLEVLLGLFISQSSSIAERRESAATDPFIDIAQKLVDESKRCTQDIWDEHKRVWMTCRSAKIIDELAFTFSPYNPRSEQEAAPKTLLPPRNSDGLTDTSIPPQRPSSPLPEPLVFASTGPSTGTWSNRGPSPASVSNLAHTTMDYPLPTTPEVSRESLERCITDSVRPLSTSSRVSTEAPSWPNPLPQPQSSRAIYDVTQSDEANDPRVPLRSVAPMDVDNMQADAIEPDDRNGLSDRPDDQDADIIRRSSRQIQTSALGSQRLLSITSLELPPPRLLSQMVDVYYNAVWPTFPLLPTRPTLETLISSIPVHSDAFTTVLLALCAYCAHLSPPVYGDVENKSVVADLWYQQARYGVQVCIKNGSSVEIAQALLLLAMADYGQGNDSQAWFLTGLAIRVGQDMDLNGDLRSTYGQNNLPPPEIRLRRNIWRVSLMLDLFLSLHFGRAPASFDGLRSATKFDVQQSEYAAHPVPTFLHAVALCQKISRIYLHLYLGCSTPDLQTPTEKLTALREELDAWDRSLPAHYRVAVGNQSEGLDILELNMLYQLATIMLYHPFSWESTHASDALIEAAVVFDELLRRYRPVQEQMLRPSSQPSLLPNPNTIYHIFTAAFAHLSGYKILCLQSSVVSTTEVLSTERFGLQTRSRLSHCLEALASIGKTWGLAQKLWKSLDKLMEAEGLRDKATPEFVKSTLGKRVREDDDTTQDAEEMERGSDSVLGAIQHNPKSLLASPTTFNVSAFPSVGWVSEDLESNSASHTRIWNGVWDI